MDLLACLRAFAGVADHGSLTRCAAACGTAPSALSRQIAALEVQAQGRLFHRTGRGVVLTDVGRRMLPRAKALLAESDALVGELRGERTSPAGTVELAVVPSVRPVVARLCARLQQEFPRIRLRAHEAFSGHVEAGLASGTVDIGLFNRYTRAAVRGAEALLRSPMVLVGPKGLAVVDASEVPFRQLAGVPLAMPMRPNALIGMMESVAQRHRLALDFRFESGSEAQIVDAVAAAGLCTVVPHHVARRDYGESRFAWSLLAQPRFEQVTWMLITSARPMSPAARVVASLLRELTPPLAKEEQGGRAT
ncbi:LysR family transcriptional regulator [Ramlibacter sp. AN1015]|uniref:LysR family transcriptional regulator n=1 Tax=Ramlibacter sp. AN1015 TaxID=3133428 RepID=UPI0030BE01E5